MDNGQWTLMRFPGLSAKPAVYVVGGDGSERLARQHGTGDFVVVEEIAPHFRLRLGPNVLDIINTAYDPAGKPTGTGTTAPTVRRDILQAKSP
jgi:type IV secretion system protein VirB9